MVPLQGRYRLLLTLTTNVARLALPLESVAAHLTKVRPIGKRAPDPGLQLTRT